MLRVYKLYTSVKVEGDLKYCARVEDCLNSIAAIRDGRKFFSAICETPHEVTITDSGSAGNSTTFTGEGYRPKLVQAICTNNQLLFKNELVTAVNNACRGGISLEHVARQLTLGLTPATYNSSRIGGQRVFTNKNVALDQTPLGTEDFNRRTSSTRRSLLMRKLFWTWVKVTCRLENFR